MFTFKLLKDLNNILPFNFARILEGPAGIGKSAFVRQLAEETGYHFLDVRFSDKEPADIMGMPHIRQLENGQHVTDFAAPEWWHRITSKTILFLDEIDRAKEEMQPLAMQLTLDREVAGRKLPDGCIVFAACNGAKFATASLDQALVNRFVYIKFTPAHTEWLVWADSPKSNVHPAVVEFIRHEKDMLDTPADKVGLPNTPVPTRRSWSRLGEALNSLTVRDNLLDNVELVTAAAIAFVGEDAARHFSSWIRDNYKPLVIQDVFDGKIKDPRKYPLIQVMSALDQISAVINSKENLTHEQRLNATRFYMRAGGEAYAAFFERIDPYMAEIMSKDKEIDDFTMEHIRIVEEAKDKIQAQKALADAPDVNKV